MGAVERLQAAIDKLETLRGAGVSPLPWNTYSLDWRMLVAGRSDSDEALILADARAATRDDFELIVTLHRTIDAQLAILRDTLTRYGDKITEPRWIPIGSAAAALALADAILGKDN